MPYNGFFFLDMYMSNLDMYIYFMICYRSWFMIGAILTLNFLVNT